MPRRRVMTSITLVAGSTGDPGLLIDYPSRHDALLFDAGDNCALSLDALRDLNAVFITHHHMDHFVGFDRILRASLDADKTLNVFGPPGTIARVYSRVKAYDIPGFDFQRLTLCMHDIADDEITIGTTRCADGFPTPQLERRKWKTPVVFENDTLRVEAAAADHTVPCLAYALVEKRGYHPDRARLEHGSLRPGAWTGQALAMLRAGGNLNQTIDIQGGSYTLATLAENYFHYSSGARVAYITDTLLSEKSRPALLRLAHQAQTLYCDSFYSSDHAKQALKHKHMTAIQAAELAAAAKVDELVLIHFSARYRGQYDALIAQAKDRFPNVRAAL